MKKFLIAATLLALLSTETVYARSDLNAADPSNIMINKSDVAASSKLDDFRQKMQNRTDEIVKQEREKRHELFNKIDSNQDGIVSKEEYVAFRIEEFKKKQSDIFDKMDSDKNGGLTEEEYEESFSKLMKELTDSVVNALKKNQQKLK